MRRVRRVRRNSAATCREKQKSNYDSVLLPDHFRPEQTEPTGANTAAFIWNRFDVENPEICFRNG